MAASLTIIHKLHVFVSAIILAYVTRRVALHLDAAIGHLGTQALLAGALLHLSAHWVLGTVVHAALALLRHASAHTGVKLIASSERTLAHGADEGVEVGIELLPVN